MDAPPAACFPSPAVLLWSRSLKAFSAICRRRSVSWLSTPKLMMGVNKSYSDFILANSNELDCFVISPGNEMEMELDAEPMSYLRTGLLQIRT